MPVVNHFQITTAGCKNRTKAGLAYTVHRIQCNLQVCIADCPGIDQVKNTIYIFVDRVLLPDKPLLQS